MVRLSPQKTACFAHSHDTLRLKSLWRESSHEHWKYFCPLCHIERRSAYRPNPRPMHYLQVAITAVFIAMCLYPWLDWKGVVSFFPLWVGFETIYRTRARAGLICDRCGFDPTLYLVDVKKARAEVEQFWRKKFQEKNLPWPGEQIEVEENPEKKTHPDLTDPEVDR
jgi:hypothetical protein